MNSQELLRRTASVAGRARNYSFAELLDQRSSRPLAERLAKASYGKVSQLLLPRTVHVDEVPYRLIAAGGQQLVYGTDSQVAKIATHSLAFDKEYAVANTDFYQSNFDKAKPHMGEHMTPTEFDLRRFRGGLFASVAIQPWVRAAKQFIDVDEMAFYRDDGEYIDELQALLDSLTRLFNHTGLQMDLTGPRNIFLNGRDDQPHLEIVDTIVVSPDMQAVRYEAAGMTTGELIGQKMNILREAVRLVQ